MASRLLRLQAPQLPCKICMCALAHPDAFHLPRLPPAAVLLPADPHSHPGAAARGPPRQDLEQVGRRAQRGRGGRSGRMARAPDLGGDALQPLAAAVHVGRTLCMHGALCARRLRRLSAPLTVTGCVRPSANPTSTRSSGLQYPRLLVQAFWPPPPCMGSPPCLVRVYSSVPSGARTIRPSPSVSPGARHSGRRSAAPMRSARRPAMPTPVLYQRTSDPFALNCFFFAGARRPPNSLHVRCPPAGPSAPACDLLVTVKAFGHSKSSVNSLG